MMRLFRSDPSALQITPYHRRHRAALRELLFRHENTHIHLDWQETDTWLDTEEGVTRLAFQGTRLVGVLAFSEPIDGACWVRVVSLHDSFDPTLILNALWTDAIPALREIGVHEIALLLLRDWIEAYIAPLGFTFREDVVTLRRANPPDALPEMLPEGITVRPVAPDDLDAMIGVDHHAFAPPWQMSGREVRQAQRISAFSTVAEIGRRVVGYQLCTVYFDGAHLARLAVDPDVQGRGIGAALVSGAIRNFARRGLMVMTVNTQATNLRSQRLYERLGFRRNGYDLPVWTMKIG